MLKQFACMEDDATLPFALDHGARFVLRAGRVGPVEVLVTVDRKTFAAVFVNVSFLQLREFPVLRWFFFALQTILEIVLPLLHLLRQLWVRPDT